MTKSKDPFIVFGAPVIGDEEIAEVIKCLESKWLGTGPRVAEFEKEFSAYKGVLDSAAVNSCTAALHLSLIASGVKPGDEVITTAMTFCATVNTIIHVGATPILIDVEKNSQNIDAALIESKITPRTKAIVVVHFAGFPCDMDSIMKIAGKHNLKVIEDCAHAIETECHGEKAGTIGDFGCFSFYSTKNIVTGEGGMVIARNPDDLPVIRKLSLHGMSKHAWNRFSSSGYNHYDVEVPGYKYNMMDLQAAIGLAQIRKVDKFQLRRKQIWNYYSTNLLGLPMNVPNYELRELDIHAHHLYTIQIDESKSSISRDGFLQKMTESGIGVGVHYMSIPTYSYYQKEFGWNPLDWPNALQIGNQTVSLPLTPSMSDSQVERVVEEIVGVFRNG
jgi:dTDP-4-amino-4,6-dideoxygalactose transaminase